MKIVSSIKHLSIKRKGMYINCTTFSRCLMLFKCYSLIGSKAADILYPYPTSLSDCLVSSTPFTLDRFSIFSCQPRFQASLSLETAGSEVSESLSWKSGTWWTLTGMWIGGANGNWYLWSKCKVVSSKNTQHCLKKRYKMNSLPANNKLCKLSILLLEL